MAAEEEAGERLISLDVLRGLAVMGMILVNAAANVHGPHSPVFGALLHSEWDGLTFADTVFPAFLLMAGVSIPIAFAKAGRGLSGFQARRIGRRVLRLVVIGFLLSNLFWFVRFSSGEWRLFGVLQRIGLVYGACAALFLLCGPRTRAAIIVATLVLYWPLVLAPSPDGLPTDILLRGHNFAAWLDRAVLGEHIYVRGPEGYDPEGLLGTLPAIAHGLIGVALGEHLARRRDAGATRGLAVAGAAMLVVGLAWSLVFPIIKDIWSSSFVLVTCGGTALALALLHAALDGRDDGRARRWPWTIALAFGGNAMAAYVLHMLTGSMPAWDLLLAPRRWALAVVPPEVAALAPILLYMVVIWAAMEWLRRKGWVIKV